MAMTKDDIIFLPNPTLRTKSQKVGLVTEKVVKIIEDMQSATLDWEASRAHEVGVALAAVQIGKLYRIVVVRNNYDDKSDHTFIVLINPEIVKLEGDVVEDYEGCLSIKDIYGKVPRYSKVRVKALDINGRPIRINVSGFLARILQHEIDHTNGVVFIDHIKDQPESFFRLLTDGKLEQLNYEKDVKNSRILWE
jgi:peptide deformylase